MWSFLITVWIQISAARILRRNTIDSQTHKSILYSCFVNNVETRAIIHNTIPQHLQNNENIESLHERLSFSISTFACNQYTHLNFTFTLQLFQGLYHKTGGFKIYQNGQLQNKPNTKQRYRSFLGDVDIFEYIDKSSFPTHVKHGTSSLTFLGDISHFNTTQRASHPHLYKCLSFSAQIWTSSIIYEIHPIPTAQSSYSTSSATCNTMILSAIPRDKLYTFSPIHFERRHLSEYNGVIHRFQCSSWENQWRHHHAIKIGLVIDYGFYDKFGNSDDLLDEYIALIFANTNGLFEKQLNIHITIGDVLVANDVPNYAETDEWWMDIPITGTNGKESCELQSNQYTLIKNWYAAKWDHDYNNCTNAGYDYTSLSNCSYIDKHASWILLSRCFEGAGVAQVGKLCKIYKSSAAVANYERDETWRVFAHELGHLFGAYHAFDDGNGGIMDYQEQTYEGIHQFRDKDDICRGIEKSRSSLPNMKPDCWEIYDYGSLSYIWRQNGTYSSCFPICGETQFKVETVECIMIDTYGNRSMAVAESNCGLELKPFGKFVICEESEFEACATSICGNGLWEMDEECDSLLLNEEDVLHECCEEDCTRKTTDNCQRLTKQIDAAFTDSNGRLYLFQGSQYAVYSNLDEGSVGLPDAGYPKYISDSFPIRSWNADFEAAFCTSDDIVYIFKDFSYVRIDLMAINIESGNAQIDAEPIEIVSGPAFKRTTTSNSSEFEFGYIPTAFTDCGRIDAAFVHSIDQATIVCGTMYYSWTIAAKGFENMYRPFFSDYQIDFGDFYSRYHKLDAASYNWSQQTLYFYAADVYIKYRNGEQDGDENKLQAMGYWGDNTNCEIDSCGTCDVEHNGKCYDSTHLVVIEFESFAVDAEQWTSFVNLEYDTNGGVFSGTNAALFTGVTQIILQANNSLYSVITNWKISLWLYPTNSDDEQDFFHMLDEDESHTIFKVNTNTECVNEDELTITVTHTNANGDDDLIVFQDTDCEIPLALNEWSKVTFDAVPYMMAVTVNSKVLTSNVIESEIDLVFQLNSWYLGTSYVGKMDYFIFQQTQGSLVYVEPEPTLSPTSPSAAAACVFPFVNNITEMIAWIGVFFAFYTVGMWTFYKYYGARVLLDHIAAQLNMQQDQQEMVNNNDNLEMVHEEVQEAAAGIAIQAIEQVLSGNVTPNILSPKNIKYISKQRDGDHLASPILQSPIMRSPILRITSEND